MRFIEIKKDSEMKVFIAKYKLHAWTGATDRETVYVAAQSTAGTVEILERRNYVRTRIAT